MVLADGTNAHSHVIEAHLGQESQLQHGFLATSGGSASLLTHCAVEQEPRSSYALTSVVQGWSLGRLEPRVVQVDGQASTTIKGLAVTSAEQQLATHTSVRFNGPEGELDQLQKCLAADRSHTIFNGAINVPREAQRTNAAQLSRNLLLSDRARVDTSLSWRSLLTMCAAPTARRCRNCRKTNSFTSRAGASVLPKQQRCCCVVLPGDHRAASAGGSGLEPAGAGHGRLSLMTLMQSAQSQADLGALLARTRADFPILDQQAADGRALVYLDHAATSQKPVRCLRRFSTTTR